MAWVESRSNQDRDCMIYCLWASGKSKSMHVVSSLPAVDFEAPLLKRLDHLVCDFGQHGLTCDPM